MPTYDGYQYNITETEIGFESAQNKCVAWGGNLVSIHTREENDFVKSEVTVNYNGTAWIGLQQIGDSKHVFVDVKEYFTFKGGKCFPCKEE